MWGTETFLVSAFESTSYFSGNCRMLIVLLVCFLNGLGVIKVVGPTSDILLAFLDNSGYSDKSTRLYCLPIMLCVYSETFLRLMKLGTTTGEGSAYGWLSWLSRLCLWSLTRGA